jgi:Ca2+-binding EF-hand superfamily protein
MACLFACNSKTKKTHKTINANSPDLLQLRLTEQEREIYTSLFNKYAIEVELSLSEIRKNSEILNDDSTPDYKVTAVNKKTFPKLLGMIGTDIAEEFAFSIFEAITDNKYLVLEQYLRYLDIYHHGDENERCLITFKLMDKDKDGKVKLKHFKSYLMLILSAIEKVQPTKEPLLIDQEIEDLFKKISSGKSTFSFEDFSETFFNKPELISWIDYFKSNDEDIIGFLNSNVKSLLVLFFKFFYNFDTLLKYKKECSTSDESALFLEEKFTLLTEEINVFNKRIKSKLKSFANSNFFNNIRSVFETCAVVPNDEFDIKADFFSKISYDIQEVRNEIKDLRSSESKLF